MPEFVSREDREIAILKLAAPCMALLDTNDLMALRDLLADDERVL